MGGRSSRRNGLQPPIHQVAPRQGSCSALLRLVARRRFLHRRPANSCSSGMTCWRRLRDWQAVGVWPGSIACCSSTCQRPGIRTGAGPPSTAPSLKKRGGETGPNPTDREPSRHEAPPCGRLAGHPRGVAKPGQPARPPDAGAYPRGCAKRTPRPHPCPQATDKLRADKAYDHRRRRIERRKRAI